MSQVYVTTYEIVGDGVARADEYYASIEAAKAAHLSFVESVGGVGFRPDHNGGLRSVFFSELPSGWRKLGRHNGNIEAVPNRSTKVGKALTKAIDELPKAPRPNVLAEAFGYAPNQMAMDTERGVIYFPTELRVAHPTARSFLRLPRFEGDNFTPDETVLRAVPESELMKAVEDHNAEAKRLREKRAWVDAGTGEVVGKVAA